jgi:phosphotransferase system IIA component
MEKKGNFSGLVSDNETEKAQPLVKPNDKAISKNANDKIRLIVVTWKPGYALTDDKMHEILQNQTIWKRIMQEVE